MLRNLLSVRNDTEEVYYHTSLVGTFKIFDADKKISGAGFKFSKASADTIASNLMQRG